jgi:hypothetical protein
MLRSSGGLMVQVHSCAPLSKLVLSCFRPPGRYYLVVPSAGRSWNSCIGPDVFFRTNSLAMRALCGQRCGTAVDLGLSLPGYTHFARQFKSSFHPYTSGIRRKSPPPSTGMRIAETSSYGQRRNGGHDRRHRRPPIFSPAYRSVTVNHAAAIPAEGERSAFVVRE